MTQHTRKRIVIEALAAGLIPCGLREYAFQVCPRLIQLKPDWMNLVFIVPPGMSGCFGRGAEYIEATTLKAKMMRTVPMVRADLFHALHQICTVKHLPGVKKQLVTVHDINFYHTKYGRSYRHAEGRFLSRMAPASHLAFISRFAAEDVAEHFPYTQPARVIYNGVTPPDPSRAKRPQGVPDGPFLLHLSSLDEYKNVRALVRMMDFLPERRLILAGNCKDSELKDMVEKRSNIFMIGRVSEEEKTWLYANCTAFLFPSRAEGFGLPPLEAMHLGKPVFLSTLTSLPEIGGNQAYYWPDLEPGAMAAELVKKLSKEQNPMARKIHAAQFSWDTTARSYIDYYNDILKQ